MQLKVELTKEEILHIKFQRTLNLLRGYIQEAKGDVTVNQSWSSGLIRNRLCEIETSLLNDLLVLEQNITIDNENTHL